jgi:hypothetical protein
MKRLLELQSLSNDDLTGNQQGGFKKQKSTLNAGILIQSITHSPTR